MHRCSCCSRPCACSGDTDAKVISIQEPESCLCCVGICGHGVPFGFDCASCATEGYTPEENAPAAQEATKSMNGGW